MLLGPSASRRIVFCIGWGIFFYSCRPDSKSFEMMMNRLWLGVRLLLSSLVDIICPSPPPPSPYLHANPIAGNWVSLFSFLNAVWINCSVCQNLVSGDLKPRHNCCTTLCHWAGNRQNGSGQVNDQLSEFWVKKKKKRNFELQLHGSVGPPSWFSFISRTVNKWRR